VVPAPLALRKPSCVSQQQSTRPLFVNHTLVVRGNEPVACRCPVQSAAVTRAASSRMRTKRARLQLTATTASPAGALTTGPSQCPIVLCDRVCLSHNRTSNAEVHAPYASAEGMLGCSSSSEAVETAFSQYGRTQSGRPVKDIWLCPQTSGVTQLHQATQSSGRGHRCCPEPGHQCNDWDTSQHLGNRSQ
jgi:hypothetical protein